MFDALIFSTVNALEFLEVRRNAIRIPEVIQRVREAQAIWDGVSGRSLDLANFIGSDDQGFLGNLRLKNLATAVVQAGLLDRFLKHHELPRYLIGLSNGDAPVKVAARQQTFDEMVRESHALGKVQTPTLTLHAGGLPILAGISLAEFSLMHKAEHGFEALMEDEMDFRKVLKSLIDHKDVKRLLVIGPGHSNVESQLKQIGANHIEVVDAVSLDPLLSWFWSEREDLRQAAVQ
ncbi:MAG: hypothetical protein AB7N80_12190 [Bdellovibrionales bacterium]